MNNTLSTIVTEHICSLEKKLQAMTLARDFWQKKSEARQNEIRDDYVTALEDRIDELKADRDALNVECRRQINELKADRDAWKRTAQIMEANRNQLRDMIKAAIDSNAPGTISRIIKIIEATQ